MRGISFSFTGPTISASYSVEPRTPSAGRTAMNRRTTPMPPIQLVMLRQKSSPFILPSMSVMIEAPAALKPDMLSKKHLQKESRAPVRW